MLVATATSFSTPSSSSISNNNFLSALADLFKNNDNIIKTTNNKDLVAEKRNALKRDLILLCNDKSRKNDANKRSDVIKLITELKDVSPIEQTATSSILQKEWLL